VHEVRQWPTHHWPTPWNGPPGWAILAYALCEVSVVAGIHTYIHIWRVDAKRHAYYERSCDDRMLKSMLTNIATQRIYMFQRICSRPRAAGRAHHNAERAYYSTYVYCLYMHRYIV